MSKPKEIIKNFLQQMMDQDNRATASPFYYVIRTKVEDPAPIDNCDEVRIYWQDNTYSSMDEIEQHCKENEYTEIQTKEALAEACHYGIKYRWERRGMFLTEADAEAHLKANHYHYSKDAHTYVEHAWRAPDLEEFISSLYTHFNIQKTKKTG